jgi:PAS domain S-box-containing protein
LTFRRCTRTLGRVEGLGAYSDEIENALELVNVPSYVLDTTGVVRWINPAARRRVGDVRGRQFSSIVAPEDKERSRELFARKIAGSESVTDAEFAVVDRNGDRMTVDVSSVPLLRGGRVVGVFGQVTNERAAPPLAPDPPSPPDPPLTPPPQLTPRQSEVLQMLEYGRSTRQIAQELHLSPETVRNHIRHILLALGVHSRLEAVTLARREQLFAN